MPPIRSLVSNYYNRLVTIILSLSKVIPSYCRYMEKKLVYIAITALSSCQPSFYTKYTRANMRLSYNV